MRRFRVPAIPSILILPVFVYGCAAIVQDLGSIDWLAILGIALLAVPLLGFVDRKGVVYLWIAPAIAIAGGVVLSFLTNWDPGGSGLDLLGGVLVGSPLAFIAAVLAEDRSATLRLLLVTEGLVNLVVLFATVSVLGVGSPALTPGAIAHGYAMTLGTQWNGVVHLVTGATTFSLPLQASPGPIFTGLTIVAWAGVLLGFVLPDREEATMGRAPAEFDFRPILHGTFAAVLFEVVADTDPQYALLALGVGVVAVLVAIGAFARRGDTVPVVDLDH
jgi:hypothetical protein